MDCLRCGLLMSVRELGGMECRRCGEVQDAPVPPVVNHAAVYLGLYVPPASTVEIRVGSDEPVVIPGRAKRR